MAITLSSMRTKVRLRMANASTTDFSNANIDSIVNDRIISLAGWIQKLKPERYRSTTTYTGDTDATDAENELYTLPSDFRTLERVDKRQGSSPYTYSPVPWIEGTEQDQWRLWPGRLSSTASNLSVGYGAQTVSIRSGSLRIVPAPTTSDTFRLTYLRTPTVVAVDGTSLDIPDEFIETIALSSTVFILRTLGDPLADVWERELDRVMAVAEGESKNSTRFHTFGSMLEM